MVHLCPLPKCMRFYEWYSFAWLMVSALSCQWKQQVGFFCFGSRNLTGFEIKNWGVMISRAFLACLSQLSIFSFMPALICPSCRDHPLPGGSKNQELQTSVTHISPFDCKPTKFMRIRVCEYGHPSIWGISTCILQNKYNHNWCYAITWVCNFGKAAKETEGEFDVSS